MSGGIIFDLWAVAFAALVAGIAGLIVFTSHRRGPKPFDWQRDAPEYKHAKEGHVTIVKPRVIDMTRRLK